MFYPAIILFIRKDFIKPAILLGIVLSIGYKFVGSQIGLSWSATNFNLLGNLDSLGLGALYAYYIVYAERHHRALRRLLVACVIFGIPLFIVFQAYFGFVLQVVVDDSTLYKTLIDLSIAMPSILVIHMAVRQSRWLPGKLLSFAPIRYIGKISYGGYVYHNFMRLIPVSGDILMVFIANVLMSLAIASLSWHIIENPINQLKRKIPYLGKVERDQIVSSVSSQVLET